MFTQTQNDLVVYASWWANDGTLSYYFKFKKKETEIPTPTRSTSVGEATVSSPQTLQQMLRQTVRRDRALLVASPPATTLVPGATLRQFSLDPGVDSEKNDRMVKILMKKR